MKLPRKLALHPSIIRVCWAVAAAFALPVAAHANEWSEVANISSTMGVSADRLCIGEGSRGDIGCPTYAPYVSSTTGYVGIGTSTPRGTLEVQGSSFMGAGGASFLDLPSRTLVVGDYSSGNNPVARFEYKVGSAKIEITGNPLSTSEIHFGDLNDTDVGRIVYRNSLFSERPGSMDFYTQNGPRVTIVSNGIVGIATTNPSTTLHVAGTLRISNGGEACDANRTGAIRYASGVFEFCDASAAWKSLSTLAGGASALDDLSDAATDYGTSYTVFIGQSAGASSKGEYVTGVGMSAARENSGTNVTGLGYAAAYLNTGANVTSVGYNAVRGNTGNNVTGVGYNAARENSGTNNVTGLGYAAAYLNTGANVTSVGVNAARENTGANVTGVGYNTVRDNTGANVVAIGYGAGVSNTIANQFILKQSTVNSTPLIQGDFATGNLGIGTTSPTTKLAVAGKVSASSIQLADNPSDTCTADTIGTIKVINGRLHACRW